MNPNHNEILLQIDREANQLKHEILSAKDDLHIPGQRHYVSSNGNDHADGLSPETAWRTLARVNQAALSAGDAVLFRRGDVFRGQLLAKSGVTYAAYGQGEKPCIYASECDLADSSLWEIWDEEHSIWKCTIPMLDAGSLVFDHGAVHSRKLIPSYLNGKFVCRDMPEKAFCIAEEMTQNLDLFCHFDKALTMVPSRGEDFPIPDVNGDCYGDMYLRCDQGNPGLVFSSIESLARRHIICVEREERVHIDNLCLKYGGMHAVCASGAPAGGACARMLHVSNCEMGWIGGSIQTYAGLDPNYPEGGRGTVTRFGNAVEIYGSCDGFEVEHCYIYQVYDAGITHQICCNRRPYHLDHVHYHDNLIENCVYGIEYFLFTTPDDLDSRMMDIKIDHNIIRHSGYGWGQQRHNTDTPAHIKGWSYVNTARDFSIHDNVFDRAAYRMLHLVAHQESSLPDMQRNTYIQHRGGMLGQYGANEVAEPPILRFDEHAKETILSIMQDYGSQVYALSEKTNEK